MELAVYLGVDICIFFYLLAVWRMGSGGVGKTRIIFHGFFQGYEMLPFMVDLVLRKFFNFQGI